MTFRRQVNIALDNDHQAALELLGRVEQSFARAPRTGAGRDPELARLAGTFAQHLDHEMARHFDFEENELFPRLADAGEGGIAELLAEEHVAIRAVAGEILPRARAAAAGTLDDAGWEALKRGALEIVERLVSHIQKETMALLPLLEDVLDEDGDRELAFAYASG
jgi:hemerythrin-like domain-containing protein